MSEPSLEHRLASLAAALPSARMALLPALRCAARDGELTVAALAAVARVCQVEEGEVRLLLETYPSLRGTRRTAVVCEGLSCYLKGAAQIVARPQDFGLETGGFERASCLGYCHAAPVLQDADGAVRQVKVL